MIGAVVFLVGLALSLWLFWIALQGRRSPETGNAKMTALESVFAAILATTIVTSWLGLTLAELGRFSLANLAGALMLVNLGLIGWLRWRRISLWPLPKLALDGYEIVALVLALQTGILYFRPAGYVVGGQDPGTYVNIGVHIARTGAIVIHDETLANVDPELADVLLYNPSARGPGLEGIKFLGFYVHDRDEGVLVPQFFHVLPVWIAILCQIGGVHLSLFAAPFFGWLAVLAIYVLGRRLIHPGAGLLAMALLALNISQLWFARNAFADTVLQYYLVSGFWALALFVDRVNHNHPAAIQAALLSGACFGISHLVKLDAFVAPPVVLGFVAYWWIMGRSSRSHTCFLGAYLLLAGHAALHGYLFPWPYVNDVIFGMFGQLVRVGTIGGLFMIPLLALVAWQRARVARFLTHISSRWAQVGPILVLVILSACAYAYFIRPFRADLGAFDETELVNQGNVINWLQPIATEPQTRISNNRVVRTYIEEGIERMGWYLTPLGVWLGIAGFLYWVTSRLTVRSAPFLGGALLACALVFYRGAIVSCYFWAFKRYVPMVIPSFVLFNAFLVWQLWPTASPRWPRIILPLTIAVFLIASFLLGSLPFWEHIEYENSVADTAHLAESLPEDAVLLFQRSVGGIRFSVPVSYVHGRDSFIVAHGSTGNAHLREIIAGWHAQGRPVFWITFSCKPAFEYYGSLTLVDEHSFQWPEVPCTLDKLPDRISRYTPKLCIYQIEGTEFTIPSDLGISFDSAITLMGYELENSEVVPGGELHLNLYWRAEQPISTDLTVFSHVLDDQSAIWGQRDSQPVDAKRPTTTWHPGDIIRDPITIPVQQDTPPGVYRLQVGLYDLATMQRLPVLDDAGSVVDDRAVLETILVTEP